VHAKITQKKPKGRQHDKGHRPSSTSFWSGEILPMHSSLLEKTGCPRGSANSELGSGPCQVAAELRGIQDGIFALPLVGEVQVFLLI